MKQIRITTFASIAALIALTLLSPRRLPADSTPPASPPPTRPEDLPRHKLEKTLEKIDLKAEPFDKVLAHLAETTDLNIAVNWRALEAAGVKPETPITLSLKNIPARLVLKETLAQAGAPNIKIAYCFSEGLVRIGTADELSRDVVTHVYDVSDLVRESIEEPKHRNNPVEQETIEGLAKLIEESIDPTSWRDAGGSIGSIRAFAGKLVITQTPESHQQVTQLLADLRQKQK